MAASATLSFLLLTTLLASSSAMSIADCRRLIKAQFRLLKPAANQESLAPLPKDVDNVIPAAASSSQASSVDEMLELLGANHFHADFMSVEDPMEGPNFSPLVSNADEAETKKVAQQVDELLGEDKKLASSKIGQKMKKKLTKLLADFTQCPVVYEWKDLGDRFWPRYIRTGSCSQKKACSFPSGMGCKPAEESQLTLLRRFCGSRRWGKAEVEAFNPNSNCRWIAIKYPIVTKCSCSC